MKEKIVAGRRFFCQKNLLLLLGAEAVILLFALVYALYPKPSYNFTPEELSWKLEEPCDTDAQGRRGVAEAGQQTSERNIMATPWMTLWRGHYRATIAYSAALAPTEAKEFVYPTVEVMCNDEGALRCYEGVLNPNRETQTILVIAQEQCDNVWLMFKSNGDRLMLGGVQLAFDTGYALWMVLALALALAALDALLLLLLPKSPLALPRNARVAAVLLGCLVLVACAPALLLGDGFVGHDWPFHAQRIQLIAQELGRGQWPVRLYTGAKSDFGYGAPLFYGEIFLYFPALLYLLGTGIQAACTSYVVAATAALVAVSYHCLLQIFKQRRLALLGTLLYTLAYCRIGNVYTRTAVGEYTAMIFLPLVLYALWLLYGAQPNPKKAFAPLVIAMSGILQSHLITLELTVIAVGCFALLALKKTFTKAVLGAYLKAAGATVLLNLWFLLPFLQAMREGISATQRPSELKEFLSAAELLTGNGYTGIGLTLTAGAVGFVLVCLWQAECRGAFYRLGRCCLVAGGIMALACTRYFPWGALQRVPVLYKIAAQVQFPWRWAGMASLLLAVATVCAAAMLGQAKDGTAQRVFVELCVALNLLVLGFWFRTNLTWGTPNTVVDPSQYMEIHTSEVYFLDTLYEPAGVERDWQGIAVPEPNHAEVQDLTRENGVLTVTCRSADTEDADVTLPLLYYPGYGILEGTGQLYKAEGGLVGLHLPAGFAGTVRVAYCGLPIWRVAEAVSAAAAAVLLAGPIARRRKKRSQKVTSL